MTVSPMHSSSVPTVPPGLVSSVSVSANPAIQQSPTPAPAAAPSQDVEMTDANAPQSTAPPSSDWSAVDSLLLVSLVKRAFDAKLAAHQDLNTPATLEAQFDWPNITATLHTKSTSQASVSAYSAAACSARFGDLIISTGSNPKLVTPLPPLSLADIGPTLPILIVKLVQERIAQLEKEHTLATNKTALLNQGIADATQRLQAQKDAQAAAAAASAAAASAAAPPPAAAPSAALPPSMAPLSSTSGSVSVKLEPTVPPLTRPPSLMSPTAGAVDSTTRPSPLITSPSMLSLSGSQPVWPNSSLHTPLKALSRQSSVTAGAAGLASPTMSRQQSMPYDSVPPTPVALSSAKIAELFQMIMTTLTTRPEADAFLVPVDPNDAVGYYDVIKNPMSFQDVSEKIKEGEISSPMQFWLGLQQIYTNCYTYNDKKTTFFKHAKTLESMTLDMFRKNFSTYDGPWSSTKKGGQGRPPKYTPATPSLTSQGSSYVAASPLASPTATTPAAGPNANSAGFPAIPLNLSAAPHTPTPAASMPAAAPTTPTRTKQPPASTNKTTTTTGATDPPPASTDDIAAAASNELPRGAPRRASVQSATKRRDADGDESMDGGDVGADAEEESVSASVGDDAVGSIHDALTTPARGANRKRAATTLSASSAAATPSARKNVRGKAAPNTPANAQTTPATTQMPTTPAPQIDDPMDTSDAAGDKKRRGRPSKK